LAQIPEPKNERSRRTRAAILDAAWQLLEEQGGPGFTMAEVSRRAGATRRAVYLHFASRSELLMALHEYGNELLDVAGSLRPVFEAPDAVTAIEEYAAHVVRMHPRILAINQVVVYGRHTDPDLKALYDLGIEAWLGCCRALMQRLADEGRLAEPWTVSTAADMLLALMRDELVETLAVERSWPPQQFTTLLATLFRRTFVGEAAPAAQRQGA
jgi:AcrR family transcriptional regulator